MIDMVIQNFRLVGGQIPKLIGQVASTTVFSFVNYMNGPIQNFNSVVFEIRRGGAVNFIIFSLI